jgi:phage recombination protein Bet
MATRERDLTSGGRTMNNAALRAVQPGEVTYETEGGQKVTLSPQIIRQYLVNGQGNVTDQEVMMFLELCRYKGLNPFLRESYLIKFGNSPATMVVGKEVFTKRAERHPNFRGHEGGVYVVTSEGKVQERKGTMTLPGDRVIGGWARVYREGYHVPIEASVSMEEYAGRKSDGSLNNQWATKPATMIRKVALVQALREAFPSEFGGMYDADEINTIDSGALPRTEIIPEAGIIDITAEPQPESHPGAEPEAVKMGSRSARRIEVVSEAAPVQNGYFCEECGGAITEKVAKYSRSKFNRALCMADQKKQT